MWFYYFSNRQQSTKGLVGRSYRAIGPKILLWYGSPGDHFLQGIEGHYVRTWSLNLLFCSRVFGLVVSVVVPSMLAVLPYMQEVVGSTPGLDIHLLGCYVVDGVAIQKKVQHINIIH
jgi:hypothetical protein